MPSNPAFPLRRTSLPGRGLAAIGTTIVFVGRCFERRRQRLDLQTLDDAALKDIGLSPADVRRECSKPFWR